MSMISVSEKTMDFLKKLKLDDLNPVLTGLKQVPIGERQIIFRDLVFVLGKSINELQRQFDLICKL